MAKRSKGDEAEPLLMATAKAVLHIMHSRAIKGEARDKLEAAIAAHSEEDSDAQKSVQ